MPNVNLTHEQAQAVHNALCAIMPDELAPAIIELLRLTHGTHMQHGTVSTMQLYAAHQLPTYSYTLSPTPPPSYLRCLYNVFANDDASDTPYIAPFAGLYDMPAYTRSNFARAHPFLAYLTSSRLFYPFYTAYHDYIELRAAHQYICIEHNTYKHNASNVLA